MKFAGVVLSLVMLAGIGISEDIKPVPETTQNKLLKAQHDLDTILGQEKDVQLQFEQAVRTQKSIQESYPELDKQAKAAQTKLDGVKTDAIKEAGLDPAKYDVDITKLTFVSKTPTVPSTPSSPEKK